MKFPLLFIITYFSKYKSIIKIEDFINLAYKFNYTILGIADENLYGIVEFYNNCKKNKIKPIIGITINYILPKSKKKSKIVLFAKDLYGYKNLLKIINFKKKNEFNYQKCEKYFKSLIGVLPLKYLEFNLFKNYNYIFLKKEIEELKYFFDIDSLFFSGDFEINKITNLELFNFFEKNNINVIAMPEVRCLFKKEQIILEILNNISKNKKINLKYIKINNNILYLKKSYILEKELIYLLGKKIVNNTKKIIKKCNFELNILLKEIFFLEKKNKFKLYIFLKKICLKNLKKRVLNFNNKYIKRLNYELYIIYKMKFEKYFLIIWDLKRFMFKNNIISSPGRGSVVGSLVAYVLYITDVDPIKYNLLFERFLNINRSIFPDIDIDIPDNKKNFINEYILKKYGKYNVSKIFLIVYYTSRKIFENLFKNLNFNYNKILRFIPKKKKKFFNNNNNFIKILNKEINNIKISKFLFYILCKLENKMFYILIHVSGIIISNVNLLNLFPVKFIKNYLLLKIDLKYLNFFKLIKFDFLCLHSLFIINKILNILNKYFNINISFYNISLNNKDIFLLFKKSKTYGIFQFNSVGIRKLLLKFKPKNIEDLALVSAIYRPSTIKYINLIINRKNKKYICKNYNNIKIKNILNYTYGIIVYQEQIMELLVEIGNLTFEQANFLRIYIKENNKEKIIFFEKIFLINSIKKGFSIKKSKEIFNYIKTFCKYSFNRSHAIAYAILSYKMAYFKIKFPIIFYFVMLNYIKGNEFLKIINEIKINNINILFPNINKIKKKIFFDKNIIFLGFNLIKRINKEFVDDILKEREKGKFLTFYNFLFRIPLKWLKEKENIIILIKLNIFYKLIFNKKNVILNFEKIIKKIIYCSNNLKLFKILKLKKQEVINDYNKIEIFEIEKKYLGFYICKHPAFIKNKKKFNIKLIKNCYFYENKKIKLIIYIKEVIFIYKNKKKIIFIKAEDESGIIELVIFKNNKNEKEIKIKNIYYTECIVKKRNFKLQLIVNKILKLENKI